MRRIANPVIIGLVFLGGMVMFGCGSIPPTDPLSADRTTAKVVFIMPNSGVTIAGLGAIAVGTQFYLWDSNSFISSIGAKQYLECNFKAGTHYFMASGSNWYIVQADLAAGKTYYFEVITLPGFSSPAVRLRFIEPGDPELAGYLNDSKQISPKGKTSEGMIKEAGEKLEAARGGSQNIDRVSANKGI
ncbi:MAG: hypothetical protein FWG27_07280 [Treponema sp.]|nr:hypothetical protein [Treponema sp.]